MAQILGTPRKQSGARVAVGVAAIFAVMGLIGAAAAASTDTQIQTAEGTLAGVWQPGFRLFEGIPYAREPPVGETALATAAESRLIGPACAPPRNPATNACSQADSSGSEARVAGELAMRTCPPPTFTRPRPTLAQSAR